MTTPPFAALRDPGTAVLPRRTQILALAVVLAGLAAVGYGFLVAPMTSNIGPWELPWPVLAIGFYIAETKVIEVPFRSETHSLSLSEVPAVIGLFFVDPQYYLLALLVGAGAGLVMSRQPVLKTTFNLAQYGLGGVITLVVFRFVSGSFVSPGPMQWVGAVAATVGTSVVSVTAIATAITLSGAAPQFQRLPQMLQVGVVIAAANTCVALLGVDVLWFDPRKLWLLAVPLGTLFYAYRAYVTERRKHESLELLYESSRVFQRSPELESAILVLLEHMRGMFGSDRAEMLIFPKSDVPLRTAVGPEQLREVMQPAPDAAAIATRLMAAPETFLFTPEPGSPGSERLYPNAMVTPLRGEQGVMGALVVMNRRGEDDPFGRDELRLFETVANQAATALENTQLEQSLVELSRLKEELRELAYSDPLTGLPNRTVFRQQIEARLAADAAGRRTVVVFLDLDDFKVVNDTLGHAAGDELLIAVGERLRASVRGDDLPARLGGDEFAVLLTDELNLQVAKGVAQRILDQLRHPFRIAGREFVIGASVGIASSGGSVGAEQLLTNADVAMYAAKTGGKGRLSVYDPEMHALAIRRHELRSDLALAIREEELGVEYQPIVSLATGEVVGVESLARWVHPQRGPIAPGMFIALAEEDGSILTLGRQVLSQATRAIAACSAEHGLGPLSVAVNVSPFQIRHEDFVEGVLAALEQAGLPPKRLVLEITETAMFRDTAAAAEVLQQLRRLGIRLAIDDFGTGYSSLGYLHRFPVDVLKIDRVFVSGPEALSPGGRGSELVAEAMIALGRALGIKVIGEGVENAEQHSTLREMGCDMGQGFHYAPGVPIASLPGTIAEIEGRLRGGVAAGRGGDAPVLLPRPGNDAPLPLLAGAAGLHPGTRSGMGRSRTA